MIFLKFLKIRELKDRNRRCILQNIAYSYRQINGLIKVCERSKIECHFQISEQVQQS